MEKKAKTKSTVYVRVATETHRRARVRALEDGVPLATVVERALDTYLAAARGKEASRGTRP